MMGYVVEKRKKKSASVGDTTRNPYVDNSRSLASKDKTVKPVHAVTTIKQSPEIKCHIFLVLSYKISYELNFC